MADPQETAPDEPRADSADSKQENLPFVEAPNLDGSRPGAVAPAAAASADAEKTIGGAAMPASLSRSLRFAALAGSVALAAMLGSLSASGLARIWPGPVAHPAAATTNASLLPALKAQGAELSALKASLDGAVRSSNSQFARIADRLDRVERAQIEPSAKIGHIADTVDRLDKRSVSAAETTGSIPSSQATPGTTKPNDRILPDWAVQSVRGGRALVASRYGGFFEVANGSTLPGLGRVEAIKRQGGQWIVLTAAGMITER